MILESIVTTVNCDASVNIAPMGPTVNASLSQITLRPFKTSTTYQNLARTKQAVVHVTDDARLFAKAAMDDIDAHDASLLVMPLGEGVAYRLVDCHRWFHVDIANERGDDLRSEMRCRILNQGTERPFFGLNRAKFAVIEAAILATRTHLISSDQIFTDLDRLRPLIEKTAGSEERDAFDYLVARIESKISGAIH